jgi:hypothetical protein
MMYFLPHAVIPGSYDHGGPRALPDEHRKSKQNRLRLAWCIPRLNAINENLLLLDIVDIIDSGRHFQHKKCPKIEGRIV